MRYCPPRADDATFLRRVHIDIVGVIPTAERITAFLADKTPDKRARVIDELLAHPRAGAGALALHLYFIQNATLAFEGSLANFWGGVLQQLVVYGAALAILGRLRAFAPRRAI